MEFLRSFLRRHLAEWTSGSVAKCRLFSQATPPASSKNMHALFVQFFLVLKSSRDQGATEIEDKAHAKFLGGRLTVRKWRPTVKNRRSLDRKRFSPENCSKCTKGDFKWKKFENFTRSTSMLAYSAQNAPSVRNTIIIIHGVPISFPVTSAWHGYWGLCKRSILSVEFGVEFCSFPLIYRWRLQSSFS